jgi:hypothetical protein
MNKAIVCKTVIPIFFIFLIGITVFSCKRDKAPIARVCNQTLPDTVSFSKNIIPIFRNNCSITGCHSGINPTGAGHLNLDASVAYSQLMQKGKGYVDTLNPNFSVLYTQMTSYSKPMPPSGNLDVCTTLLVLKWIQQKAKNN